jgi:transcription factor E2F3
MSENNSSEMLQKKRGRGRNPKSKEYLTTPKIIKNKFKLGSKGKLKTPHINIIKPKPIKKDFSYNTQNINQYNTFEKIFQDEESDLKREDSVQENSLGKLTKDFINYIKTEGRKSININDLVNKLGVKKRRIYDITNVLQGIEYLQKSGKNEIIWTKTITNKSKAKKKPSLIKKNNNNKQKLNKEELEKEKKELDDDIEKFKAEFNSIAKKGEFEEYGYITLDDIKKLSINKKVDLVVIKATKGTVMNVIDKKDIKQAYDSAKRLMENNEMKSNNSLLNILNKSNQLILSCPENVGLNIYEINNGDIKEIQTNKNGNENSNNDQNIFNNKIMNNNLNNLENSSKIQIKNKNPISSFNKQNININNNSSFNSNIFDKKYASNISNEKGNLETVQHNFNVNNKQPNIGISCATPNQKFGNYKYTNTYQNINNNVNNNNKEESFSITKNFSFSNMGK